MLRAAQLARRRCWTRAARDTSRLPRPIFDARLSPPIAHRPFRQWYESHYGAIVGKKHLKAKKEGEEAAAPKEVVKQSKSVLKKVAGRQDERVLDPNINSQFDTGRLLACISSRPGQCGRADGFILEGKELEFYVRKMAKKKK